MVAEEDSPVHEDFDPRISDHIDPVLAVCWDCMSHVVEDTVFVDSKVSVDTVVGKLYWHAVEFPVQVVAVEILAVSRFLIQDVVPDKLVFDYKRDRYSEFCHLKKIYRLELTFPIYRCLKHCPWKDQ